MAFRPTWAVSSHKLPPSSRAWLARQFKDPYVKARLAYPLAYRSRSAFKLLELDKTFHFLSAPYVRAVVDLGAAPGGWSQVVAGKLGWIGSDSVSPPRSPCPRPRFGLKGKGGTERDAEPVEEEEDPFVDLEDLEPKEGEEEEKARHGARGTIVAVDLLRMEPIPGVKTVQMDFLSPEADACVAALLGTADGKADVVLSDMAANFTGNREADTAASLQISQSVFEFVRRHLRTAASVQRRKAGALVLKHFASPSANKFRKECLDPHFNLVKYVKPPASRSESAEAYWVCLGFKGVPESRPSSTDTSSTP